MSDIFALADRLRRERSLPVEGYAALVASRDGALDGYLRGAADEARRGVYGTDVYVRGLIEISSCCKNDCLYCGLRRSNQRAERYRLTPDEILSRCDEGYLLGYRTFVLQGGEDPWFTDERLCPLIGEIKRRHPDCAVTLSLGERPRESYQALFDAGADRYLLRHETADEEHYRALHPDDMSYENRMRCLSDLREIGYQVGCGFMVGSPGQTPQTLARDLKFIEEFGPEMCGIGPFIPHHDTAFANYPHGSAELTCRLISILRLMRPNMLIPATTALATVDPVGREKGVLAGANVVMPNLSPPAVKQKYAIYDGKACTGEESAECRACLERRMESIGFRVVIARGDFKK